MKNIAAQLATILPAGKIKASLIDRYAYAADAGFYYLLPQAVVQPSSMEEIQQLFAFAQLHKVPVVFRTAGTSLSGQSVTDGLLIDLSRYWRKINVEKNGILVRVQPGAIAAAVNAQLKRYGRKVGPDPASISAAMMGGIISNNSSGMCCGVHYNAYHTLYSIKFMLPDGKVYNTEQVADYDRFRVESAKLYRTLVQLKAKVESNGALAKKIKEKYKVKNTVGYSLNALLDFEHPLDIMARLLVGAEGTLGFIAEAVLVTIPDLPAKKTGLLFFEDPQAACNAIPGLIASGAVALELMDRAALRSVEDHTGAPPLLKQLPQQATAILCEYQAETKERVDTQYAAARSILDGLALISPALFSDDANDQLNYWKLRKGMYPSVAAARRQGHTVILEDITLPVNRLGEGVVDIQKLMQKHGYGTGIIFGHAKEGNLHFVITQSINEEAGIQQFEAFSFELSRLVIHKYKGSLKGEHGTGRQVAPFVKEEWGSEAYEIMRDLKKAVDPHRMLNPGVLLSDDERCHLKNLKSLPVIEEEVDKCVECGYCENRCPSRDFTLTPRQRIAVRRAFQRMKGSESNVKKELISQYQFAALDTCAVDGMCAVDCPVSIDTGALVKRLRMENQSPFANRLALNVARHFNYAEIVLKILIQIGSNVNRVFGENTMHRLSLGVRKLWPSSPIWLKHLKGTVSIPSTIVKEGESILYVPTCITRIMGAPAKNEKSMIEQIISVAAKAGYTIILPPFINGYCCGQAFSSKGFHEAYKYKVNEAIEKLWHWSKEGEMNVLVDVSSCTHSLQTCRHWLTDANKKKFDKIKMLDSIEFIADYILPRIKVSVKKSHITLHPVCSLTKMGLQPKLEKIAAALAVRYHIPLATGCCGMAGDRGFYYPGLIKTACEKEAAEVNRETYEGYYSSSKPCEIAMSNATSQYYRSLFSLLDETTKGTATLRLLHDS